MPNQLIPTDQDISRKIHTIRGVQVMLDEDLAILYQTETKILNQAVKRNIDRFPKEFCFQLAKKEHEDLRSQFVTSNKKGGRTYHPYAFTEQGVAMLSAVLRSDIAIKMSIQIMSTFVSLRNHVLTSAPIYHQLNKLESRQLKLELSTDHKFDQVFNALSRANTLPQHKLFFEGQFFDAHEFISKIIRSAKQEIILIDNYIDERTLSLFIKRKPKVKTIIYCKTITQAITLDLDKFNSQYPPIILKQFALSHDRFLIIDQQDVYHLGASIKDLGKKWFACTRFDSQAIIILQKLQGKSDKWVTGVSPSSTIV